MKPYKEIIQAGKDQAKLFPPGSTSHNEIMDLCDGMSKLVEAVVTLKTALENHGKEASKKNRGRKRNK